MNLKSKLVSIVGAGIIALSMVGGVAAQNTTTVPVDVVVSVPTNSALTWTLEQTGGFSAVTSSFTDEGISTGQLTLTVQDTRFTRQGWSITLSSGDLVGDKTGETIPATHFVISTGTAAKVGDQTLAPIPTSLTMGPDAKMVLGAKLGSGSGRYTLPLTGTVKIPVNVKADTYKTSITVNSSTAP